MATQLMAFELPGFEIGQIGKQDGCLEIEAEASRQWAMCPKCGWRSRAIHSHYQRRIQDLPISGQAVWLKLRVRRFRCRNQACPQRIFAERLPD